MLFQVILIIELLFTESGHLLKERKITNLLTKRKKLKKKMRRRRKKKRKEKNWSGDKSTENIRMNQLP